jgi:hypothetical protein
MISWFLLLVPIITIVILLIKYSRQVTWWEYLIHIGVAIILIAVMKIIGEKSQTNDTEYWGDLIKETQYYEPYSIWDHETCTRQVYCGSDSKGNAKYRTETYDCSHLDSYPARWQVVTTTGWEISVSAEFYNSLVQRFQTGPSFRDISHEGQCGFGDYVVKDGDMYFSKWDGNPAKSYALTKKHTYENKVQCSHSVFNYQNIDKKEAAKEGLYDYPDVNDYEIGTILGGKGIVNLDSAEQKFRYLNGDLGPKKQLRVWVLIFKNKPIGISRDQEAYWKGGNKNEFVITIGLDKTGKVTWCHPFSWTEVSALKIGTRNYVMEQKKLNLSGLSDYLHKELGTKWKRKEFKDFSYLTVEPPLWALIVSFLIQIAFSVGYAIWAVRNDYEN